MVQGSYSLLTAVHLFGNPDRLDIEGDRSVPLLLLERVLARIALLDNLDNLFGKDTDRSVQVSSMRKHHMPWPKLELEHLPTFGRKGIFVSRRRKVELG